MWKIALGFVVFAALALFVISKGGDSLDMGGEKHDTGTHAPTAAAPGASAAASASAAVSSAASEPVLATNPASVPASIASAASK